MLSALDLEWGQNEKVAVLGRIAGVDKELDGIHRGFSRRKALAMRIYMEDLRW